MGGPPLNQPPCPTPPSQKGSSHHPPLKPHSYPRPSPSPPASGEERAPCSLRVSGSEQETPPTLLRTEAQAGVGLEPLPPAAAPPSSWRPCFPPSLCRLQAPAGAALSPGCQGRRVRPPALVRVGVRRSPPPPGLGVPAVQLVSSPPRGLRTPDLCRGSVRAARVSGEQPGRVALSRRERELRTPQAAWGGGRPKGGRP